VVATDSGSLVEVQGTGEGATFSRSTLDQMLDLALKGCQELTAYQATALIAPYPGALPRP
ncbi:MAG TPA: ribonuclease PH, partial [Pseudonocardiaceae bacterium]|nr:ribonuclease PH [Pseudonocardiaceae bacterium]